MGKKTERELKEAFETLKAHCIEVQYIESGTFQGGEEESFLQGAKPGMTCFVFSPDFKPHESMQF